MSRAAWPSRASGGHLIRRMGFFGNLAGLRYDNAYWDGMWKMGLLAATFWEEWRFTLLARLKL